MVPGTNQGPTAHLVVTPPQSLPTGVLVVHDLDTLEECLSVWVCVSFVRFTLRCVCLEESHLSEVIPLSEHCIRIRNVGVVL